MKVCLHVESALDITHISSSSFSSLTAVAHKPEGPGGYFLHHIASILAGCISLYVRRQRDLVWKTTLTTTPAMLFGQAGQVPFSNYLIKPNETGVTGGGAAAAVSLRAV